MTEIAFILDRIAQLALGRKLFRDQRTGNARFVLDHLPTQLRSEQ